MAKYIELMCGPDAVKSCIESGFDSVCVAIRYRDPKGFKKEKEDALSRHPEALVGAVVSGDFHKSARKAIMNCDLVIADVSKPDSARNACECWEVDMIVNPEQACERDMHYNPACGLDMPSARLAAERGIGYIANMGQIIDSKGRLRCQKMARIAQSVKICQKAGMPIILSMCAKDPYGVRNPYDLFNLASTTVMNMSQAGMAIGKNPQRYLLKASRRSDPDCIMEGLRVIEWGGQNPGQKKRFGWY